MAIRLQLFRNHFNIPRHGQVPSAHAINSWVPKFEDTSFILNLMHSGVRRTVRTAENVERVQAAVKRCLRRSSRKQASALNIRNTSVLRILHKYLNFHPYEIQILQELKEANLPCLYEFLSKNAGAM